MKSEIKKFIHFKNESFTRKEASEYLGVKKSFLDINATINRYQIPFYKIGKQTRYLKEDLDNFILNCKIEKEASK
jgi:excisionase family DNA binding protein